MNFFSRFSLGLFLLSSPLGMQLSPAATASYVLSVPNPAAVQSTEFVLGEMNGLAPLAGLTLGPDGAFYGTTSTGGLAGFLTSASSGTSTLNANPTTTSGTLTLNGTSSFNYNGSLSINSGTIIISSNNVLTLTTGTSITGTIQTATTSSAPTAVIQNLGTVFRITPSGKITPLVAFTGNNGASPTARLRLGPDGNFYGTTDLGGTANKGTIFKVTPAGVLTTLVSFTGKNGAGPVSNLTLGRDGNFYGTTEKGGPASSYGTVFKVTPAGQLTTLVAFDKTNGRTPAGGLFLGTDGKFYGTTVLGGAHAAGTVFKLTSFGTLTTLFSFDHKAGAYPGDGVVRDRSGNCYGTTGTDGTRNLGTVFRLTSDGVLTTLAKFTGENGSEPVGGLTLGADGNFYGATDSGGTADEGTAFRVTPTGVLTRLVSFTGANGSHPQGGLLQGANGMFYGTTSEGGSQGGGVVFALSIPGPQKITFPKVPTSKAGQTVTLAATASSGLPVTYRVVSGPAMISGSSVTFTAGGKVLLAAAQAGGVKFAPAPEVTVEVTVNKNAQTLTPFAIIADRAYSPIPFTFDLPVASSGLPVTVKVKSGKSKISGNTLTLTGVGEVTLIASQSGNASFFPAKEITTSFLVRKAAQTITLGDFSRPAIGESVVLSATASSGLPVKFAVAGAATLAQNTLTVTGAGQIILKAQQPGNANYLAAPTISRVLKPVVPVSGGSVSGGTLTFGSSSSDGATNISLNHGGGLSTGGATSWGGGSTVPINGYVTFVWGSASDLSGRGILMVITLPTMTVQEVLYPVLKS